MNAITKSLVSLILIAVSSISPKILAESSKPQLKVGVLLPLSGPIAEYGNAFKNGMSLAQEDNINIQKEIKFLIEDNQYDPVASISALRKFSEVEKVTLAYNFGGRTSAPLVPVAEQLKLPLLLWASDETLVLNKKYSIRFVNKASEFTQLLVNQFDKKGFKNIKIFPAQNAYISSMLEGLQKNLKDRKDIKLDIDPSIAFEITDLRSLVTKLKINKYDAVGVFLGGAQIESFYRELKKQNVNITTFGTDFFESASLAKAAGDSINGAFYANHAVNKDFAKRYKNKFGNDYQIPNACLGYDFVNYLFEVNKNLSLSGLPKEDREEVLANISKKGENFLGITGKISYAKVAGDRYFKFPLELREIRNLSPETMKD